MKKNFLKAIQTLLVFSLAFTLTSCWNFDNPLEDLEGSGSGSGGGGSSTVAVTGISLNKDILRLDKNDATSTALTATVEPSDATDPTVSWTSDDETVATVDATGKITMHNKAGKATIKAEAGDKKAECTVFVYDKIHNINTGGNANVTANEEWLINGNGTAVANKITIGDGATVTLNGINITNQIECSGDATIILADGSTNTVDVSGTDEKAGIQIGGGGKTLTINAETAGTGKLTAKGANNTYGGAGIGTGTAFMSANTCGAITINGGTVTATGGKNAAGIGTGDAYGANNTCGAITINGGTVTATGGNKAAGIGTGNADPGHTQNCVQITIGSGVTSVTANRGSNATNPIGKGAGTGTQTCGTIKFGTTTVFTGTAWNPATMVDGNYDGLNLAISSGTWTLTPAP